MNGTTVVTFWVLGLLQISAVWWMRRLGVHVGSALVGVFSTTFVMGCVGQYLLLILASSVGIVLSLSEVRRES